MSAKREVIKSRSDAKESQVDVTVPDPKKEKTEPVFNPLSESTTLGLLDNKPLIVLIRAIRGKGVIRDIIGLLGEIDLTKLPVLIDLVTEIISTGKPKNRAQIIMQLNAVLKLIVTFSEATSTTIDDQLAALAKQIINQGPIRDLLIRILSAWFGVRTTPAEAIAGSIEAQSFNALGISWVALFQLATLIYKLITEMLSDE